ncbi:MAG: hypothetical protein EBR99_00040 [Actinobacteria bacterium]|nr:hypothetical protein [Actinomycetota bacterium]
MAVKTVAPAVTVSYVQSGGNYVRVHNKREWASLHTVSASVNGREQADIYIVIAPSDLQEWCAKYVRQLVRLYKSNPDRFNALLIEELPTLSGYKWFVRDPRFSGLQQFVRADGDQWANVEALLHLSSR